VKIEILMNNSSGPLPGRRPPEGEAARLGLEPYVEVIAHIDTENEKRLVPVYRLDL
jgi:hypothetical protein